jgi:hypothetical protein
MKIEGKKDMGKGYGEKGMRKRKNAGKGKRKEHGKIKESEV